LNSFEASNKQESLILFEIKSVVPGVQHVFFKHSATVVT